MNTISFQDVYQTTTARGAFKLGQRAETPDGRDWVYVLSAEALTNSSVVVPDAVVAVDTVSSSADAQGRIVYITKASAGWTIGAFEDAIGVIDDGTGKGQTFKIKTNDATTLTLYPETALTTALSVTDSDLTIMTMANVDMAAITSKVQNAVGANQVAFANAEYGWALTNGDGRAVAGSTLVVGANFTTGDDTEGQVIVGVTAKGEYDLQSLGTALVANAAVDMGALVRFNIR